ncbi:MAG TPA: hypothetical protein VFD04_25090 [Actinomycetes bacterium]|jgi:hypothetical protein|nr:hypothetical protein [Actinomycetes bacterium]
MIPMDELVPELLLALGAAFLLGNLAALVRARAARRGGRPAVPAPPKGRVLANIAVGLLVSVAALAALVRR